MQIDQLYQPLFLFVKKRINNLEDAEDLTQEVFYKLARSNNNEVDNLKSWVYTIAKNTITDYYRKKKIPSTEMESFDLPETPTEKNVAAQLSTCVGHFVKQLPEDYRHIMTLSELENVPQKEIAEQLDMNYVTVRSKIQRGRKKLKKLFSDCCVVIQGGKGSILGYEPQGGCNSKKVC